MILVSRVKAGWESLCGGVGAVRGEWFTAEHAEIAERGRDQNSSRSGRASRYALRHGQRVEDIRKRMGANWVYNISEMSPARRK